LFTTRRPNRPLELHTNHLESWSRVHSTPRGSKLMLTRRTSLLLPLRRPRRWAHLRYLSLGRFYLSVFCPQYRRLGHLYWHWKHLASGRATWLSSTKSSTLYDGLVPRLPLAQTAPADHGYKPVRGTNNLACLGLGCSPLRVHLVWATRIHVLISWRGLLAGIESRPIGLGAPAPPLANMVGWRDKPVHSRSFKPVWLVLAHFSGVTSSLRCFPDRSTSGSSANACTPTYLEGTKPQPFPPATAGVFYWGKGLPACCLTGLFCPSFLAAARSGSASLCMANSFSLPGPASPAGR